MGNISSADEASYFSCKCNSANKDADFNPDASEQTHKTSESVRHSKTSGRKPFASKGNHKDSSLV